MNLNLDQIKAEMREISNDRFLPQEYENGFASAVRMYEQRLDHLEDADAKLRRVREKVKECCMANGFSHMRSLEFLDIIDAELKEHSTLETKKQTIKREIEVESDKELEFVGYRQATKGESYWAHSRLTECLADITADRVLVFRPKQDTELLKAQKRFPVGSWFKNHRNGAIYEVRSVFRNPEYSNKIFIQDKDGYDWTYSGLQTYFEPLPLEPEWPELELKLKDKIKEKEAEIESLKRQINLARRNLGCEVYV